MKAFDIFNGSKFTSYIVWNLQATPFIGFDSMILPFGINSFFSEKSSLRANSCMQTEGKGFV